MFPTRESRAAALETDALERSDFLGHSKPSGPKTVGAERWAASEANPSNYQLDS